MNITLTNVFQDSFIKEIEKYWIEFQKIFQIVMQKETILQKEIDELFRIAHSIKGLAMMINEMSLAKLIHNIEDLFFYLKEKESLKKEEMFLILKMVSIKSNSVKEEIDKLNKNADERYHTVNLQSKKTVFDILYLEITKIVNVMSQEFQKKIAIEFSSTIAEVKRDIYKKISMCVLQMVKNSIDHGIEKESVRILLGKNEKGKISVEINKTLEGIFVCVSDDGKGIDKQQVLSVAQEKGILEKPVKEYTDNEIYRLILKTGFTTKKEPNLFSGRGIGLDVVNKNVIDSGGFMIIDSEEGKGSRFIINIPEK